MLHETPTNPGNPGKTVIKFNVCTVYIFNELALIATNIVVVGVRKKGGKYKLKATVYLI